jgi:hypothetical protein
MTKKQKLCLRLIVYPIVLGLIYSACYLAVREGLISRSDIPFGCGAFVPKTYLDPVPATHNAGNVSLVEDQLTIHISGTPTEMGIQYGTLLKDSINRMAEDYIEKNVVDGNRGKLDELLERVRVMRPSIPKWYLDENDACAKVAGLDPDLMLLAQCEGDIISLGPHSSQFDPNAPGSCSGYVVFGNKAINGGDLQVGRNFDYIAVEVARLCSVVNYYTPQKKDGYAFVSVGWTGVLGGWTLVNTQGLVVANNLGGGHETNPNGIPTLIMTRILAQKAGTIDEALEIIKSNPRMRGQIIWLAQAGDSKTGRTDRAVAVEYDAKEVFVQEADQGVLITTNTNQCFANIREEPMYDDKYLALKKAIQTPSADRIIRQSAQSYTLHSVEVFPTKGYMVVAHGNIPAQNGPYIKHKLPVPALKDQMAY